LKANVLKYDAMKVPCELALRDLSIDSAIDDGQ
jgi:hypothetical protein